MSYNDNCETAKKQILFKDLTKFIKSLKYLLSFYVLKEYFFLYSKWFISLLKESTENNHTLFKEMFKKKDWAKNFTLFLFSTFIFIYALL
jgi:hypothetical protein